jgi:hypothetical protein
MLTGFGELMNAAGECPAGIDQVIGKPIGLRRLCETLAQLPPRTRAAA